MNFHGIEIDFNNDKAFTPFARRLLMNYYARSTDISPQTIFARACLAWSTYHGKTDLKMAQFLYNAVNKRWFMFSSPLASNTPDINPDGTFGEPRGLPISCFLGFVPDTIDGLIDHTVEFRKMSVAGGGYGGHWSKVRSASDKSPGAIPFICTMNSDASAYQQGRTRKGSYAAYMQVDHPDIWEFLTIRVPTGADANRKALDLHHAVNFTNAFMRAVEAGTDYELIDPHRGKTGTFLSARAVWEKCLQLRDRVGEPFMWFVDTANEQMPQTQRDAGLRNHGSNLCTEISQATDENRTAVCCLVSPNVETFDEWRDTELIHYLTVMLDNVTEYFIEQTAGIKAFEKARFSATQERALGIGRMGFGYYLQKHNVAFDSEEASFLNAEIQKSIGDAAIAASRQLAVERGEAPDMRGTGMRNTRLFAVAPNANSGLICGTTPADEPPFTNLYSQRTRGGIIEIKNPYLADELEKHGLNTDEVWTAIRNNDGSIQNLDVPEYLKVVFKTAPEIPQEWIIIHAATRQRQPFMQAQSVNLFPDVNASFDEIEKLHRMAWELGLLSLYYYRGSAPTRADLMSDDHNQELFTPDEVLTVISKNNCVNCAALKARLLANEIAFTEMNIDELDISVQELTGRSDIRSLPVVVRNGKVVTDLSTLFFNDADSTPLLDGDCVGCQS